MWQKTLISVPFLGPITISWARVFKSELIVQVAWGKERCHCMVLNYTNMFWLISVDIRNQIIYYQLFILETKNLNGRLGPSYVTKFSCWWRRGNYCRSFLSDCCILLHNGFRCVSECLYVNVVMMSGRDFIAPCKCKGSGKYVHRECLDNWRSIKVYIPDW